MGARMGGPKAMMNAGAEPWCLTQRARLDRLATPFTWVISPELFTRAVANNLLCAISPRVVSDSNAPMFTSLLNGVMHVFPSSPTRGGLFVLPVDVPVPRAEVWHALAAALSVGVPTFRGVRGHPVFISWRWLKDRFIPAAASPTAARPLRLDQLIAPDATHIEVDDSDVAVNLNTPDDVAKWLTSHRT